MKTNIIDKCFSLSHNGTIFKNKAFIDKKDKKILGYIALTAQLIDCARRIERKFVRKKIIKNKNDYK